MRPSARARALLALLVVALGAPLAAPARSDCPERLPPAASDPGLHAPLDRLLRAVVREGGVDYACLVIHRATLDDYREYLAALALEGLSEEQRLALWINAYNAFTLELILRHLPGLESIKDIPRGRRWRADAWEVAGRRLSLHEIEHGILRERFDDPRFHVAINCASLGCPDLRDEAYVAERLDAQLDEAARRFLADPAKGARAGMERGFFGGATPTLRLSKIFDWFERDFVRASGSVLDFVRPYLDPDDASFVERHAGDLEIEHLDYDWSLNRAGAAARAAR